MVLLLSLCVVRGNLINETPLSKEIVWAMKVSNLHSDYPRLVAELSKCENYGKWDNRKIVDSNKKYSYGGLQFQKSTFLQYGHESAILPEWIDETNFETYIYDKDIQTLIAEYMIGKGIGKYHWVNCFRIYNLSQYL